MSEVHSTNLSIGYINDVKLFVGAGCCCQELASGDASWAGVLDIFGFECFKMNSFEQNPPEHWGRICKLRFCAYVRMLSTAKICQGCASISPTKGSACVVFRANQCDQCLSRSESLFEGSSSSLIPSSSSSKSSSTSSSLTSRVMRASRHKLKVATCKCLLHISHFVQAFMSSSCFEVACCCDLKCILDEIYSASCLPAHLSDIFLREVGISSELALPFWLRG